MQFYDLGQGEDEDMSTDYEYASKRNVLKSYPEFKNMNCHY